MTTKLTEEQIKKWRTVLAAMVGPYAFFMSNEEIQKYRDDMQNYFDGQKGEGNAPAR